jgi:hypothetical protein
MTATQDDEYRHRPPYDCGDPDCPPGYHRGEHVPDMDEGDPEMEAWMDSLPPVDIDRLARDLKHVEVERGLDGSD